MKLFINILSAGIIFLAIVFIPVKSFSQEWSSVQISFACNSRIDILKCT